MLESEKRDLFHEIVVSINPSEYAEFDFRFGEWGGFARLTNITGDEADAIEHQLDGHNSVDCETTESGAGLAVEIFTTDKFE